jgi:hypothetical protein
MSQAPSILKQAKALIKEISALLSLCMKLLID